ncbi:hypothetical protein N9B36_04860 [Akkermansiaceae bacterium]|nr:hypothetical protein [Akkermansiaceae bacterium]
MDHLSGLTPGQCLRARSAGSFGLGPNETDRGEDSGKNDTGHSYKIFATDPPVIKSGMIAGGDLIDAPDEAISITFRNTIFAVISGSDR